MTPPYLLLDIDGVLIPFPAADGSTPPTHVRHTVLPTGRHPDDPVPSGSTRVRAAFSPTF